MLSQNGVIRHNQSKYSVSPTQRAGCDFIYILIYYRQSKLLVFNKPSYYNLLERVDTQKDNTLLAR